MRPTAAPTFSKRAPWDGTRHFFEGQKKARPTTVAKAGIRVSAATTETATAMASDGPIERNMPSVESSSARKAATTAPPAEAMASPARSMACATASRCSSPSRSRSR
ncbi:hypothetical protein D9M70_602880 [compost metagenome]